MASIAFLAALPSHRDALTTTLRPLRLQSPWRLGTKSRRRIACEGRSLHSFTPRLLEPILLKGADSAEELVVGLSVFLRGVFDGRQLDCA